ncbi:hypothetical protein [uncultured Pseudokineococcus sp.]|uniref:hypothetical protein n=1 Tax=uncultured Pseudokineococcus sp. TaxID=1642928 RepID=UPI00260C4478|nr:hypothetical protein [uncultured Pseudokineococcus sp.]
MAGPAAAAAVHLAAAAAYAGFQWTVRVVVYPQLATAALAPGGEAPFPALEAAHSRRVSRLVGPLFLLLVGSTGWLVVAGHGSADAPLAVTAAGCTAVVLAATALGAVPQHRVLGSRWDPAAHRRLVRWDGVRVAAATLQLGLALVLVLR